MQVGSLVICIDDTIRDRLKHNNYVCYSSGIYPVKGQIYTIRGFNKGLLLEEIVNEIFNGFEPSFSPKRFREIQRPTSIFLSDLLPEKVMNDCTEHAE